MEQQQRSLIFTAAVGLIILAIIVGSIYYLVKFVQGRVASNKQSPQASVTQIAEDFAVSSGGIIQDPQNASPAATPIFVVSASPRAAQVPQTGTNTASDKKVHNSGQYQLVYPKNWGILSCTNSGNTELDPLNGQDQSLACELAVKPITIVVGDIKGCEGEASKVGNVDVVKSQASDGGYTKHQWCTKTTPVLNITHRVSTGGERATSKEDYSKQIEEIIANLTFTRGS